MTSLVCAAPAYADRAFAPRYSATERGSTTLAGNTVLTCTTSTACTNARNGTAGSVGNDTLLMTNVDVDGDSATFNSSRAVLTIPSGATVLFAALYWGGDTAAGLGGAAAPSAASRNVVRLTTPTASAQTVTASVVDADASTTTRYQGFADVTTQVALGGSGTYTVGNVQTGTGTNRHGGWSLVVAYRLASEPFRRLQVYDGFLTANATTRPAVDIPLAGFLTPVSGTVKGRLGVVAYEGDRNLVTDSATLGGHALVDAVNPASNFFNASRSKDAVAVATGNPTYANTLGLDVDDLNVDGVLANGVSSTSFTATTTQDDYSLGAIALAVADSPPISAAVPTVAGTTIEGNTLTAAPGIWNGTAPISHAYRWQRCTAAGASCADIAGATGATYALVPGDVGSRLRVVVTATNAAGSTTATSAVTDVIAADPPETTIATGPSGLTKTAAPTFTFSADEAGATFQCRVDTAAFAACASPFTTATLADGQHTFEVRAIDLAGAPDPTPATRTFTVDATVPDTTITSGPAGAANTATPSFSFTASETGATFECRIDGGAYSACSSPRAISSLTDGQHTFEVRAIDAAGNTDGTPAARTFTVDTRAPETTITGGPSGTTANNRATVTFTADETGATFQCRVDGGAFASCSSPLTTAALGDGSHTVEVRAVDTAGNADASPAARTFTVDTAAPSTAIDGGPAGATPTATPTFTFSSGEPGATFQCRIDGGAFAACASPYTTPSLPDGAHTIEVRAIDAAGNVDATPDARAFRIDTVPPETTITGGPAGTTDDPTPTFTFADDGSSTFQCRIDGGAFVSCASPFTAAELADGAHTFSVRAIDAAGNVDPTPATRAFTVRVIPPDADAPETTIDAGPPPVTADSTPDIAFSSSEASTFACRIDDAAFAPCTSPLTLAPLGDGQHTFEVRATDTAGNVDATPAAVSFKVDTDEPETTLTGAPPDATADPTPTFAFGADEHPVTFQCRVDGAAFAACDAPFTTAALPDGEHTFQVRAVDAAGNADPAPASRTFTVDTVAPETALDSGPAGPTSDATPDFAFHADEPGARFQCRVDAAPFAACESPHVTAALDDGAHTFSVRAIDAAGNTDGSPAMRAFTVDTAAPQTAIDDGPDQLTPDATPDLSFSASEPGATFECRVDGAAFAPCSSPLTLSSLDDGQHTFAVRATDAAGNTDGSPAARVFTVDTDPPQTTITSGPSGLIADASPAFAFSADEPGSSFECSVDGAAFAACDSPLQLSGLADGAHTVAVRATDAAGNADATSATRSFVIDTAGPGTSIDTGPSGPTNDATPTFAFAADEAGAAFECRVDGARFAACESPITVGPLDDGQHRFEVRAVDAAGNPDATPAAATFTVDTTAPDTTVDSGPSGLIADPAPTYALSSTEDGATFECRADGEDFTPCASPWTVPALADGQHTISFRAVDAAGNADPTPASRIVTVDADPPDTAITRGPPGLINDARPAFEFTADEPDATFQCRVDAAPFTACDSPARPAPLGDGQHTFEVRAVDHAGNVDPTPAARTVTIDTAGPQTTIDDGPSGPTTNARPAFSFSAGEAGTTFECRVDDAPYAACDSPYTVPVALADGPHAFFVRAVDAAGNADDTPASRDFTVDTTAPAATITAGPEGPTGDATPSFSFSSGDGDATFECRVDDDDFATCASPLETDALGDGDHTFQVRAVDAVGNVGPAATRRFSVDTVVPDTSLDSGPSGLTADATPSFTFSSSDPAVRFECSVDGGGFAACDPPFMTPGLADGAHTFAVRAVDPAGNRDATPAERTITVDTEAPETDITDGPTGTTDDPTPRFEFTDGSTDDFECRLDGGPYALCRSPYVTEHLDNGNHVFEVRAIDQAGNADPTPAARAFTVEVPPPDEDDPVTAIDSGPDAVTADTTPQFAFSANEAATFDCRVDDGDFAACTSPFTSPGLGDGQHLFEVRATDQAGNVDATPVVRSFLVDTAAPGTEITRGPPAATADAAPVFAFAASEPGARFECRIDGGAFAPCASPVATDPLPDGAHTFEVRAIDAAGNADPTPAAHAFVVDTAAPGTTLDDGPTGVTADATPTFTFGGDPGTRLECRIDGAGFAPCTSPLTTDRLGEGRHTFETRAVDAAGNADPTPAAREFTVDTEPPRTTIDHGPPAVAGAHTATFAFSADEDGATFECRVDSAAFAPCTSPFTTDPLPDGAHELDVRAIDPAGNADASPAAWSFTLDNAAPTTTITGGPPSVIADATPRFTFTADEPGVTFRCRIDGGDAAPCDSPFDAPALGDGTHTFEVYATDAAGNAEAAAASRTFKVDALAPQTAITAGPDGPTHDPRPVFDFTSGEPGTSFECRIDEGAYAPCEGPLRTATLADGPHSFDVFAVDDAGNRDRSPASRSFVVDTREPATAIDGPSGPVRQSRPAFTMSSDEAGSTFQCRVDDGSWSACSSPFAAGPLPDGAHTVAIRAVDAAGNADPSPPERAIVVDTQPPDTSITGGPPSMSSDSTPTFSFVASEPGARLECHVDDAEFAPCTSPLAAGPLADGDHTFEVRAVDAAGNADPAPAVTSFTIESRPPQTTIASGPPAVTSDPTPTFTFSASEPGTHFECRIVDAPFADCTSPYTVPALPDGTYTLEVRAIDAAGNVDATPAQWPFTVRRPTSPAPTPTPTPKPPPGGGSRAACADGVDNDGDGAADSVDPGCLSGPGGGYVATDPSETDDPGQLAAPQLALRCGRAAVRLIDVRRAGRRVIVSGAARPRYIGRTVDIRVLPGDRHVASVKVGRGGGFHTTVKAPRKVTNKTFYRARLGALAARKVKLKRRTVVAVARVRRGRVVIRGRLVRPLLAERQTVVIRREVACNRLVVAGRTRTNARGAFRISLRRPARIRAAIYVTSSRVRHAAIAGRTVRTNSLPLPIALR